MCEGLRHGPGASLLSHWKPRVKRVVNRHKIRVDRQLKRVKFSLCSKDSAMENWVWGFVEKKGYWFFGKKSSHIWAILRNPCGRQCEMAWFRQDRFLFLLVRRIQITQRKFVIVAWKCRCGTFVSCQHFGTCSSSIFSLDRQSSEMILMRCKLISSSLRLTGMYLHPKQTWKKIALLPCTWTLAKNRSPALPNWQ